MFHPIRTEVHAQRVWMKNSIDIAVLEQRQFGSFIGAPVSMVALDDNAARVAPTLSLTNEQAQQLMDQLWICGLRPTEGTGSAGSLAATERHLEDMRKVSTGLLRKLGIEL